MADFNIGKDQSVTFISPITGGVITWGNVTDFESSPISSFLQSKPISSPQQVVTTYDGWKGSFTVDRVDQTVDAFFALAEQMYWTGGVIPDATITENITDALTQAVHTWTYIGVALKLDSAGSKKSNATIVEKVAFECSRRIQIS